MKIETIHDMIVAVRFKPNLRKLLCMSRKEFEGYCKYNQIIVNANPIDSYETRLEDGVNIVEVVTDVSRKYWIEVYNRKVVRSYIL
ncbi:Uncharacterized protein BCRIVMBC845_06420 [Bacillus cereus]|nr:Uncharacterized protein BCRIVMBC845_06420 [Bacillus cereus]